MSSKTTNYNLHKIDLSDAPPDITVLNQNWETIDRELVKSVPFVVTVSNNGSTYTVDKTFNELVSMHNIGRPLKALYNGYELPLSYVETSSYCVFSAMVDDALTIIAITADNQVFVDSQLFAPRYSYGEVDLTAGVSTLASGKVHFVYE